MSKKIIEALSQFDTNEDSYWTEDGLPLLEAIHHLTGDETITRQMVTELAPGFSRINPSIAIGVVEAEAPSTNPLDDMGSPGAEVSQDKEVPSLSESEIKEANDILEADGKKDGLTRDERDALEAKYQLEQKSVAEEISKVVEARNKLEQQLNQLYHRETAIYDKLTLLEDVNKQTNALQDYQKSQAKVRHHRGEQIQRLREANINLKDLIPQKSPIDQIMGRKNTRHSKRQVRALLNNG